jgi:hypothetical protein
VAQAVEHLPPKCEAQSSNHSIAKRRERNTGIVLVASRLTLRYIKISSLRCTIWQPKPIQKNRAVENMSEKE